MTGEMVILSILAALVMGYTGIIRGLLHYSSVDSVKLKGNSFITFYTECFK